MQSDIKPFKPKNKQMKKYYPDESWSEAPNMHLKSYSSSKPAKKKNKRLTLRQKGLIASIAWFAVACVAPFIYIRQTGITESNNMTLFFGVTICLSFLCVLFFAMSDDE